MKARTLVPLVPIVLLAACSAVPARCDIPALAADVRRLTPQPGQWPCLNSALAAEKVLVGRYALVRNPGRLDLELVDEGSEHTHAAVMAVYGSEFDKRLEAAFRRLSGRRVLIPVVASPAKDSEQWQVVCSRDGGEPVLDVGGSDGQDIVAAIAQMRTVDAGSLREVVARQNVTVRDLLSKVEAKEMTAQDCRVALKSAREQPEAVVRGLLWEMMARFPESYTQRTIPVGRSQHGYASIGQVCQALLDEWLGWEDGLLFSSQPSERVVCAYAWGAAIAFSGSGK